MTLPHNPYASSDPYAVDASGSVVPEDSVSEPAQQNIVPKGTSAEVLDWVGDDKDRARLALASEEETSKPRKGLVEELNTLLDESDPVAVDAEDDTDK
jgi:hypothetical protein